MASFTGMPRSRKANEISGGRHRRIHVKIVKIKQIRREFINAAIPNVKTPAYRRAGKVQNLRIGLELDYLNLNLYFTIWILIFEF
jgi:hypothetical protein